MHRTEKERKVSRHGSWTFGMVLRTWYDNLSKLKTERYSSVGRSYLCVPFVTTLRFIILLFVSRLDPHREITLFYVYRTLNQDDWTSRSCDCKL